MLGFRSSMVQTVLLLACAVQYWTFNSVVLWYFFASCLCIALVLSVLTYDYDYWVNKGVFSPPACPVVGHILPVARLKQQAGMCFKDIYDTYKDVKFLGIHQFYTRTLVIRDPELIKRVCVNDFHHFVDRGFFFNREVDPLAESVLFLRGNEWKKLRAKISPIFSPIKLRGMYPLIENTANEFIIRITNIINKHNEQLHQMKDPKPNGFRNGGNISDEHIDTTYITEENNVTRSTFVSANDELEVTLDVKKLEVKKVMPKVDVGNGKLKDDGVKVDAEKLVGGYTADAIVPCAFGLKSNVMDNEDDPFAVALQAFYEMSLYNIFEKTMQQFWPSFALFFRMRIIPKKTHDFFTNIVTSVLRAREIGVQEKRGDFIDMMMALRSDDKNNNSKAADDVEITDMVISANAFIIFLGGFETTSSTLAFLFLELAAHSEVQEKMRKEIEEVMERHGEQMSYEALQELTYMEMVIQETLRLYPPFPMIQRMCTKEYVIPGTDTVVERGTTVLFPTLGIQRDEQYFDQADSFIPERWAEGWPAPPPGVYMPFGDGPRYCIGKRFAQLQMKCCLVRVLRRVRLRSECPRTGPFAADPRSPHTLHPLDSTVRISLL